MEIRVYGVDINLDSFEFEKGFNPALSDFNEEMFIEESERQGLIWSLEGFQKQFNFGTINSENLYILIKKYDNII
jgi:hypothetical protein